MAFNAIRRHSPQTPSVNSSNHDELKNSLEQLLEILQEENAVLENNEMTDSGRFIERKNAILRDIMLYQRMHPGVDRSTFDLVRLKTLLNRNTILLKSSIMAVKDVAEAALSASRDEDSDMTYSSQEHLRTLAS